MHLVFYVLRFQHNLVGEPSKSLSFEIAMYLVQLLFFGDSESLGGFLKVCCE